ncbi:amidase family protein [Belnapia rosea]|uniref:amidase family protein n=1 Tax=Belnapia rosea TaxID=938405 RepID=UPI0008863DBF|nr:amidase family protein [Belnapia rosea]SDB74575.1 aspartyl-tRNA(Asn)/glutamyl-tRNA(Gln) amidotransferase subunit A [Belnapia rosea]
MISTELNWLSATELTALVRRKAVSPVEIIDAVLAQIERHEPRINAFVAVLAEEARAAARAAEAAVMSGAATGLLHGVPVTIKDVVPMEGLPMRSGSLGTPTTPCTETAPVVTRLVDAGAIVIGRTTTPEFGWTGVSHSPLTGATHNPWKHGYNTGASSAGAGAAAAAGFGPLHEGSDGAGSVRMPAHFSGVFGMKPSFGRIPYYPVSLGDLTSHVGPVTRTVGDAALMMKSVAGPHPWDHTTLEAPPADYTGRLHEPVRGRRIAFSPDLGHARVDPEVAALVRKAAENFAAAAEVELIEVTPTWGPLGPELGRFFWSANLSRLVPMLAKWEDRMDPGLVACIRDGQQYSLTDYQVMRARKYRYIMEIHRFFEGWDLLLTPTVSVAAFPLPRLQPEHWEQHPWDWMSWAEFSYPFNHAGNPAASVPCGFTLAGLPVGLQFVGRRHDDVGVLQAAALFEKARPWTDRRPPLAG